MLVRRLWVTCVFLLFAACLTGCVGLLGPPQARPENVGAHPVGVTTIDVRDDARDRDVVVEVWYPAVHRPAARGPLIYRLRAAGVTVARLRSRVGAQRGVAVSPVGGKHPVVLLSHGAGSSRFGNVTFAEVLASHGYIVAAPDHDGHTTSDKVFGISAEARAQSALDRPLDLSNVLDSLERRSKRTSSIFHGAVDSDRVAVAGHSFGGRAALGLVGAKFDAPRQAQECKRDGDDRRCLTLPVFGDAPYRYRDPRVKAALLLTPAGYDFYRADGVAAVDAPVLVVGARRDITTPYREFHKPTFDALPGSRYLLELENAGHLTATDICAVVESIGFLADAVGGERAKDGCGDGFISADEALNRVTSATLPFFELYLEQNHAAKEQLRVALGHRAVDKSG